MKALLALLFVQFCFGLFPFFGKLAFAAFPPEALAAWRILSGGVILFLLAVVMDHRRLLPPRHLLFRIAFCGSLGIAFNQICFLQGLSRVPTINSALILALIPVLTFLFATLLRQEAFVKRRFVGVLVAGFGISYLIFERGVSLKSDIFLGNLALLMSASSYSLYLVLSRPILKEMPPLLATAWIFLLSSWTVPLIQTEITMFPANAGNAWWALAWIIVFPTVLAYLLNLYAMVRLPSSTIAFFVFLQPLITATVGIIWLDEKPTIGVLIAAPCVFLGMFLVIKRRPRAPVAPLAAP
ncbi:MAG TPA: DMT family transporter [Planctomycetota bacterium]|jgi:drug/metabolite transporter (DMT)-like permease|nr:DMT family transporter [Planctomycetota bacterium]